MAFTWVSNPTDSTGETLVINGACWSPGLSLFAAVGSRAGASVVRIWTSPDGVTWTNRNAPSNKTWQAVDWSPSLALFVAVSSSTTDALQVMTSPDGSIWTAQTSAETNQWQDVIWSAPLNLFVAVASTGTNRVMTSPDGVNWTFHAASSAKTWNGVAWGNSVFVATAGTSGTASVMTSPDGTNWTDQSTTLTAAFNDQSITYSTDLTLFVATDNNNGQILRSANGTSWATWSGVPSGWASNKNSQVRWSPELDLFLCVAGNADDHVITSPDGLTWTTQLMSDVGLDDFFHVWDVVAYSPTLEMFALFDQSAHDVVATAVEEGPNVSPTSAPVAGDESITVTGDAVNGGFNSTPGLYVNTYWVAFGDLSSLALDFNVHVSPASILATADTYQPTVTVVSTTVLTADTPPIADGVMDIAIILNTNDTMVKNLLFYLPGGFTGNPPTLSSIFPASGTPLGGTPVTLTGTHFFTPDNGAVTDASGTHVDNVLVFGAALPVAGSVPPATTDGTSMTAVSPANPGTTATVNVTLYPGTKATGAFAASVASFSYPPSTLSLAWTWTATWWTVDVGPFTFLFFAPYLPDPLTFDFGFFFDQIWFPPGYEFTWATGSAPDSLGWWLSITDTFQGAATIVDDAVPRDPRSFTEIATFASGSAGMMGGFPGVMTNWQNRLLYAKGEYTVGTDRPPIHLFDGQFDHEIVTLPPTTAGVIPKAAMSMFTADGQVYVSTFDSGTSSADWSGRVFALDIDDAALTQVGATFPAGHIPYCFTSHMGKLWCGTNRQDPTDAGRVYSIRPGVDTVWTLERDLATDSVGGCISLLSYKGILYIGTSADTGTFAKVIARDTAGAYTTSLTGSGGIATENNAFLAMVEFETNLYASYYNGDTPKVAKIYKFDGTSWSTPFTASTTATRVPFIGFPTDSGILLAIGGGRGFDGALLSTTDGTTWTDRTVFLTQSSPTSTGLPAFGVVVR